MNSGSRASEANKPWRHRPRQYTVDRGFPYPTPTLQLFGMDCTSCGFIPTSKHRLNYVTSGGDGGRNLLSMPVFPDTSRSRRNDLKPVSATPPWSTAYNQSNVGFDPNPENPSARKPCAYRTTRSPITGVLPGDRRLFFATARTTAEPVLIDQRQPRLPASGSSQTCCVRFWESTRFVRRSSNPASLRNGNVKPDGAQPCQHLSNLTRTASQTTDFSACDLLGTV
jgi:hypothetical protein